MSNQNFSVVHKDGIATLTINRPQVHNAMNAECWQELGTILDELEQDSKTKALIITGAGEKAFISGADINFLKTRTSITALEGLAQKTLTKLSMLNKPTIAAVNGVAFGAGCELALACDIRIASETAKFGLPEVGLGILPGAGGTQRLVRVVGQGRALEMILTGRPIKAQAALDWGLVTHVVPAAELMNTAKELAELIMQKAPLAVCLAKKAVAAAQSMDIDHGLYLELLSYSVLISSQDKQEGVDAFLSKRPPQFRGE